MNEGQDHANLPYFGNAGRRAPKEVAGNLFDMLWKERRYVATPQSIVPLRPLPSYL